MFEADFSGSTPLAELGWDILATAEQSTYEPKDGMLRVTCHRNWHNGGLIRKRVPVVKKGVLDFEANIAMENQSNALGVALTVGIYNISTWYHDYCRDWRRYFPAGPNQRLPGFSIEPVGHKRLTAVKKNEWAHYRIVFDHDQGVVEYYRNDMQDPVHIDYDVPVLGRDEYEGGYVRIGSMGLTKGSVVYGLRHVVLKELLDDDSTEVARTNVLLFEGIASDQYALGQLAREVFGEEHVRTFTVATHGAAVAPSNQLKLDRLPSAQTVAAAAAILLVDMPAEPGGCLPPMLLQQVVQAVINGADLAVFGGMFSLGKGGYQHTPLAAVLPVQLAGRWDVRSFGTPQQLEAGGEPVGAAAALWYHDVELNQDAEALMCAAGKPMLVRRALGQGSVSVFLGVPAGTIAPETGVKPFWEAQEWRDWLKTNVLNRMQPR